ncbi:MAG: glycosyltransferase [Phycisphaeraceae bacterium]|nr:glycosyltransferase [Phycisphaerales bacterium]MCB9860772.1 glycosyltransferase [Phycisphaeraceae bacterium]
MTVSIAPSLGQPESIRVTRQGTRAQEIEHKPQHGASGSSSTRKPRVVLAHDWTVGVRGGEHVLERIAGVVSRRHDVADLLTMFDSGVSIGPCVDALKRHVSDVGELPEANLLRRWLLPAYPFAVGSLSRTLSHLHEHTPIDLVISTSSSAIKNLRIPSGVKHVCYCHSPARYLWSQRDESAAGIARFGLKLAGAPLRYWDKHGSQHVTRFIANSSHVQQEIQRCFHQDADVIHPPVQTSFFTPSNASEVETDTKVLTHELSLSHALLSQPFLLYVAALEPYKRVDLAIDAALVAGLPLLIAGHGSQASELQARYNGIPGLHLLGKVSNPALRALYRKAHALIFPQIEDFGMIAAEAQACGCPVIARRKGGALDIVRDHETGIFFDDPDPSQIAACVRDVARISRSVCSVHAQQFSEHRFDTALIRVINTI